MKKTKKTEPCTILGEAYPYHPKVGDRVRFRPQEVIGWESDIQVPYSFTHAMHHLCGTLATVIEVYPGSDKVRLANFTTKGTTGWGYSRQMLEPVRMTAKERAKVKRMEAQEKAKQKRMEDEQRRAKAAELRKLSRLPLAARKAVMYLREDKGAFGCQRKHVAALVGALTGCNISGLIDQ